MNSAVSVIVTCYNHEAYIAECLQSIFQQTYQAIQLIVIDDGSEDNSPELIQELLMNASFFCNYLYSTRKCWCVLLK